MRVTEFWDRMREQFGRQYADVVARDQVIGRLGHRTPLQALEDGVDPREIWLAVCEQLEVPVRRRH